MKYFLKGVAVSCMLYSTVLAFVLNKVDLACYALLLAVIATQTIQLNQQP